MSVKISTLQDFERELTSYLELELNKYAKFCVRDTIKIFDLGCFPWHSLIELSFLTDFERDLSQKEVKNPAEWRLYNFASNSKRLAEWLGKEYEKDYNKLDTLLDTCAKVVASSEVLEVLDTKYKLHKDFYVTVLNPDEPKRLNFCEKYFEK